jgi:hypothetical protein
MTEPTKKALTMAREAGRAMRTEPGERRGVDACPFPEGDPQRAEWLQGFAEALEEERAKPDLHKELQEAIKIEDKVSAS